MIPLIANPLQSVKKIESYWMEFKFRNAFRIGQFEFRWIDMIYIELPSFHDR